MIRTRDLIVFIAILFFLALGIALTVSKDTELSVVADISRYFDPEALAPSFSAEQEGQELDRQSIIDRLRNALAQNDLEVTPSPSVEETVPEQQKEEDTEEATNTGAQRCSSFDDAQIQTRSWPLSDVSFTVQGGLREVVHTKALAAPVVDVNASTTATASTTAALPVRLLQLPVAPLPLSSPACLPSEVVGVTLAGSLMYNTEVDFYKGYGSEYLIGYARDGFPIYGYYEGTVDACGGYMHAQGYRYTVTADREVLLSCYTAAPSSFTGL